MGWRQCFIIEHPLRITLEINHYQESSVEVLRWVGDNISPSKHPIQITSQINQSQESFVEVLRWVKRKCFIIQHPPQITLQINYFERILLKYRSDI